MHVFRLPKEYSFEKASVKGTNFDTKDLSDKAKFAIIEVNGDHEKVREKECTFFYLVLEGKGSFEIEGKTEKCRKGDLVAIPQKSVFKYSGKMKMLLVTVPWWYPEQEETL